MKKILLVFVISTILITSCQSSKYEINAHSDLKKYSMAMSSSPGLPIAFRITGDEFDYFEVTCEKGKILLWNDRTGVVSDHGDRLSFDEKERKIYWSLDETLEKDTSIKIMVFKNKKKVYEKKYVIEYLGDNLFGFIGDK